VLTHKFPQTPPRPDKVPRETQDIRTGTKGKKDQEKNGLTRKLNSDGEDCITKKIPTETRGYLPCLKRTIKRDRTPNGELQGREGEALGMEGEGGEEEKPI